MNYAGIHDKPFPTYIFTTNNKYIDTFPFRCSKIYIVGNKELTEFLNVISDMKLKNMISSRNDADALSGLVISDLRTVVSNLDRIISRVKERENLEKKKSDQIAADKKQKSDAAQPVKCTYCGTLNLSTAVICKSCSAQLKK